MAEMHPSKFIGDTTDSGEHGEALVYAELEKLPKDWVVIHDLWRYYVDQKGEHVNYETDFIVLVPGHGFVVIEVKNWYNAWVENGAWRYKPHQAGEAQAVEKKAEPVKQAYLAAKKLDEELKNNPNTKKWYCNPQNKEKSRAEFRALAVLIRQSRDEVEKGCRDYTHQYVCGVRELQTELQERIEELFEWREDMRRFSHEHVKSIRDYLLPTIKMGVEPAYYSRMMDHATTAVRELLAMLEDSTFGISVRGCAGSGKTWVALDEMQRLANKIITSGERKKILYLCFNAKLSEHVKRDERLKNGIEKGIIKVATYPALWTEITGLPWSNEKLKTDDPKDISALKQKISENGDTWKYDYIMIDEAQDFRFMWWSAIASLSSEGAKLYYFSDSNQNLFNAASGGTVPMTPTQVLLKRNLRNTAEIARFSSAVLPKGHEMEPLDISLNGVVVLKPIEDRHERARAVSGLIRILTATATNADKSIKSQLDAAHQYKSPPVDRKQIVVLSPYKVGSEKMQELCSVGEVAEVNSRKDAFNQWERGEDIVLGTTIKSFKGLESDYIILTDIDEPKDEDRNPLRCNDFYVACTRAKLGLYIIPRTLKGCEYAKNIASLSEN